MFSPFFVNKIYKEIFYYGTDPWDGPKDMYDMFQLEGTKKEKTILEKYIPNYKINLIDAERMEGVENFSTDLQVILSMLKYRNSREELEGYINNHKKYFQKVDYETSQAMKAFLNMKNIPGKLENREDNIDMCRAIQEMYDDGVKTGIEKKTIELVLRMREKKYSIDEISSVLGESKELIQKICKMQLSFKSGCTVDELYQKLHEND